MINVSTQLKKESLTNRNYYVTANVTLSDGTTLKLGKKDFFLSGNSLVDSADSGDFPVGVAIEKTANLSLVNDDGRFDSYNFNGARFVIFLNLQLSDKLEIIKRGTYIVSKKPATASEISLSLLDKMHNANKTYDSNLSFPCTVRELLSECCRQCGITLGDATFPNADFQIQQSPSSTTYRTVIGMCAGIAGGNARIDENDLLRIITFDKNFVSASAGTLSTTDYHTLSSIQNLQYDVDDIIVTGVKYVENKTEYMSGQDGYVITIDNQLLSGNAQSGVEAIGSQLIGLRMRPFSCDGIANGYATFGDPVEFTNVKKYTFKSFVTDLEFTFGGSTSWSCNAKSAEEDVSEFIGGQQAAVEQSEKDVEKKLSAYDVKLKQMNELAANTLGFYYTEEVQTDGSTISYRHDKPTLADSKVIYKTGVDGFFLSVDGGQTWKAGFDSNGDAVLNILSAIGINANWINVGTLLGKFINAKGMKVTDKDNRTTFYVDEDGKVIILPEAFLLADKSIDQTIIEKAQEEAKKQTVLNVILSNEYQGIPTDANGNYTTLPECSTTLQTLSGTEDVTADAEYAVTEQDITGTWDAEKHTYTATGISADVGYVEFTVTYKDFSIKKQFTIAKQKQGTSGADAVTYYIDSDATVVVRSADGTYTPKTILFKNYEKTGKNEKLYNSHILIQTTTDGTTFTTYVSTMLTSGQYTLLLSNIGSDVTAIRYTFKDNSLPPKTLAILTIPIINDTELTEQQIFNLLTDNGARDILTYVDGKLFLNGTYIKGKTVAADKLNVTDLVSLGAKIGGWTINNANLQSVGSKVKLIASGKIQIGNVILASDGDACTVKYGLHIYAGTDTISDGTDKFKVFNLNHVTSGGHLVFASDGATVSYLSSSSKRYKNHVANMTTDEAKKVLEIPIVWFKYKDGYLDPSDWLNGKEIPGFYAEDAYKAFPEAAQLNENGQPEDWNYRTIIPAMLKVMQDQQETIDNLVKRVEKLEKEI